MLWMNKWSIITCRQTLFKMQTCRWTSIYNVILNVLSTDSIAVKRSAKVVDSFLHFIDQHVTVRQIRVGMLTSEIRQRHTTDGVMLGDSQLIHQDALYVRTSYWNIEHRLVRNIWDMADRRNVTETLFESSQKLWFWIFRVIFCQQWFIIFSTVEVYHKLKDESII